MTTEEFLKFIPINIKIFGNKPAIYYLHCTENQKIYIGSSKNPKIRFLQHKQALYRKDHGNSYLQSCFDKYGEQAIKFNLIENCEISELINKESYYLSLIDLSSRLNLAPITKGCEVSAEWRYKVSISTKRALEDPEKRAKISKTHKGKKFSSEHRQKTIISRKATVNQKTYKTKNYKLTFEEAGQVKELLKLGYTTAALSRVFKVNQSCIGAIKRGKTWKRLNSIGETLNLTENLKEKLEEEKKAKLLYTQKHYKLDVKKVKEIKILLKGDMMIKDIAALYKVNPRTISEIKCGRNWTRVL